MNVDVIAVNFHSRRVLPRSMRLAHDFVGAAGRLIVVDNSPGDGAVEEVQEVVPQLTVVRNASNRGFAAAVNQGIEAGSSELVLLLNPDVTHLRGDYGDVVTRFERDGRLGAVAVRLLHPDGSIQRNCRADPRLFDLVSETVDLAGRFPKWQRPKRFRMLEWDYGESRAVDSASGACLFLRRRAIEDVGLLDERFFVYWEETDWLVRAKHRGWRTVYAPEVEAVHPHGSSSDAPPDHLDLLLLESQYKYANKHFGRGAGHALRATLLVADLLLLIKSLPRPSRPGLRRHLRRRLVVHVTGRAS